MSQTYTAQGINLRHHPLGEADRIVAIFTREHGLVRAVAKGLKKPASQLGGRMELLHCNTVHLRRGRSLDQVTSAETVRTFGGLRLDFGRLALGLYLAEVLHGLLPNGHPQPVIYDLFVATLSLIESLERPDLSALWFQLRLLAELGQPPGLQVCHGCQRRLEPDHGSIGFQRSIGAIVCAECRWGRRDVSEVPPETLVLLRRLQAGGVTDLSDITSPPDTALTAQRILGETFACLADREIKSLKILLEQAAV